MARPIVLSVDGEARRIVEDANAGLFSMPEDINEHLGRVLEQKSFRTTLLPPTHNFDTETLISDWS